MAKLNIPLNGSNYTSDERSQAFNEALGDDHQIDCGDEDQIKISDTEQDYRPSVPAPQVQRPSNSGSPRTSSSTLSQALEHTYTHQSRTMEIHQQYLGQQQEYMQLITAVLDQQGNVLRQGGGAGAAQLVETFQRTLDNFHALREQGIKVHQEFLAQQAAFSNRYLQALETGNGKTDPSMSSPVDAPDTPAMEWIVQQPPIVVDDHRKAPEPPTPQTLPVEDTSPVDRQMINNQSNPVSSDELGNALLEIVADKTGYPADMLELEMDLEADLGIDSIKRVEILGTLEERYPSLPAADTEILGQTRTLQEILDYMDSASEAAFSEEPTPAPTPAHSEPEVNTVPQDERKRKADSPAAEELTEVLLEIVAEKTGYPADMLEPDMDMEADLGIDSIKRVEILGAMEERVPGLPPVETEKLAELRTLGQIVEMMEQAPVQNTAPQIESGDHKKKGGSTAPEVTAVRLKTLPAADRLISTPDTKRPVIISAGETELAVQTASLLQEQGWSAVLWIYPDDVYPLETDTFPEKITSIKQSSSGRDGIQQCLEEIRERFGKPGGLIHIHPPSGEVGFFSQQEDSLIKEVFLLSGALKEDLSQPPREGRNLFLSVIRADGALGLKDGNGFLKGSGLSGLVKTLRWEWPDVFCRFIDLDPDLSAEQASSSLMKEIHDPNRTLVEIGIGDLGRVTLEREKENNDDQ